MDQKKEKTCTGCKGSKPFVDFYKNKTNEDGCSIYCKKCTKLNSKKYYQKKLLKQAGSPNGVTIKEALFPSNFASLGDEKAEVRLKMALIERMMLTVNKEIKELFDYQINVINRD